MIATQSHLDHLARRIELAYCRQHPGWVATALTPGVWSAAAVRLNDVSRLGATFPIDPELYVAVQDFKTFRRDPWRELTQECCARRYRASVRKIVKQLKRELEGELNWSDRVLESGRSLDELVEVGRSRISPIAKLALCVRHQRDDLAELIRPAAEAQRLACPLYASACRKLMPDVALLRSKSTALHDGKVSTQQNSFFWN